MDENSLAMSFSSSMMPSSSQKLFQQRDYFREKIRKEHHQVRKVSRRRLHRLNLQKRETIEHADKILERLMKEPGQPATIVQNVQDLWNLATHNDQNCRKEVFSLISLKICERLTGLLFHAERLEEAAMTDKQKGLLRWKILGILNNFYLFCPNAPVPKQLPKQLIRMLRIPEIDTELWQVAVVCIGNISLGDEVKQILLFEQDIVNLLQQTKIKEKQLKQDIVYLLVYLTRRASETFCRKMLPLLPLIIEIYNEGLTIEGTQCVLSIMQSLCRWKGKDYRELLHQYLLPFINNLYRAIQQMNYYVELTTDIVTFLCSLCGNLENPEPTIINNELIRALMKVIDKNQINENDTDAQREEAQDIWVLVGQILQEVARYYPSILMKNDKFLDWFQTTLQPETPKIKGSLVYLCLISLHLISDKGMNCGLDWLHVCNLLGLYLSDAHQNQNTEKIIKMLSEIFSKEVVMVNSFRDKGGISYIRDLFLSATDDQFQEYRSTYQQFLNNFDQ